MWNRQPAGGSTHFFRGNASVLTTHIPEPITVYITGNLNVLLLFFCFRNLRQNMKAPVKNQRKKNRRKRTRDDSQGPRVAKQQRLNSSNRRQNISMDCTDDDDDLLPASVHSSSPGFEESKEHEADDSADTHLTFELIPTSVSLETTKPRRVSPRRKTPEKTRGFRDLLAQLRGNSSMIVRETR